LKSCAADQYGAQYCCGHAYQMSLHSTEPPK
jgi:hypothetical protein